MPVLLTIAVDYLVSDSQGTYIDGTLGGGGHAAEILGRLGDGGKLLAFDKDIESIGYCENKFRGELDKGNKSRLILNNRGYSEACSIKTLEGTVKGILLDLGVSSRQLDIGYRGFSWRVNFPLDMRFSGEGTTAEDLVNTASEEELLKIFRTYGEDPFAEKVAQRLVRRRCVSPLRSSFDLRTIVEETVPPHLAAKTLSRIFQALRIAVNDELGELQSLLACSDKLLNPGGRIVVIAYHSLEDRLVKTAFKEKSKPQHIKPEINSDYNIATTVPTLRILTTKPILPSDSELAANPRARSAKMRVAERV